MRSRRSRAVKSKRRARSVSAARRRSDSSCFRRPPFVALFALIVESSSLASLIGVSDLLEAARQHVESDGDIALPVYVTVLVAYFLINFPVSLVARRLEKGLA